MVVVFQGHKPASHPCPHPVRVPSRPVPSWPSSLLLLSLQPLTVTISATRSPPLCRRRRRRLSSSSLQRGQPRCRSISTPPTFRRWPPEICKEFLHVVYAGVSTWGHQGKGKMTNKIRTCRQYPRNQTTQFICNHK
uniref:Uncharacterized protein n=1 Tax=Haemonchus placei TaxID=6290 RepID=A0A0N4WNF4_HAEPC